MTPTEAERVLRHARRSRRLVAPFTDTDPDLDEHWGYDVQDLDRQHRTQVGERVLGAKLGLTSLAKQQRMGVAQPIVGFLTDAMLVTPDDLPSRLAGWSQPRIEPEIAFRTARDLAVPLSLGQVAHAVDAVTVAAEVIDSRYADFRFRLPDVVADSTSAAGYLLGPFVPLPRPDDLGDIPCELEVDGQVVHTATGAAILGHPLLAVVHLSRHLAERGQTLPAGSVVLAGALTDAVPLVAGSSYVVRMGRLGTLTLDA